MRPIDQIIVACCATDAWLARICVASIRYWYPERRISLLKDTSQGDFDTSELESYWNVRSLAVPDSNKGSYIKFEAYFLPGKQRIFLIDADTVFLGRFLEKFESFDEDFIGHWTRDKPLSPSQKEALALDGYYDIPALKKLLPDFEPPDFFFNSGHLILTSDLLKREEYVVFMTDSRPPKKRFPTVFLFRDQGLLNLLLVKMWRSGRCTLRSGDFVKMSRKTNSLDLIDLEQIRNRNGYPFLVHWAEPKTFFKSTFARPDLLNFFEDYYYSVIPGGGWKRRLRLGRRLRHNLPQRWRKIFALRGLEPDFRKLVQLEENISERRVDISAILSPMNTP